MLPDAKPLLQRGLAALGKAVLDRSLALIGLCLVSPLFALVALAILLEGQGPLLFIQERPGLDARPFRLYKFRTMRVLLGPGGLPLPDGDRVTPLGAFLRRASLDELPQLWNVLRGELSLVGPRPLLMQYLPRYSAEQARRHSVRPGITGWAQVNGRNAVSWSEKFALDLWYVDHWSMRLDLNILLRTVACVLSARGVADAGPVTSTEFRGSEGNPEASPLGGRSPERAASETTGRVAARKGIAPGGW